LKDGLIVAGHPGAGRSEGNWGGNSLHPPGPSVQ